ncbi:MAG: L-aspartate oxidase [Propionibacteriaceae bacterium]|jgi:L-aspartate oxidase|nr:L-aspartate oxidase [Propionibacteriaceae bacterium]
MKTIRVEGPVIVGAGLAGLAAAVELSPKPSLALSAGPLREGTSTDLAQGGVAAAVGDDDSPALHAADTIQAGAGLCDPATVARVTAAAPEAIGWLVEQGVRFDRRDDGSLKRGLEGAHSRRRIVHANGDQTGAEIERALLARAKALGSITLREYCRVTGIVVEDGRAVGVLAEDRREGALTILAEAVVLATGGIGGLFAHTTNPLSSRGQGLALAARAGAALRDIEMVQFHPTAMAVGLDPMPLVSEAVRGEGAILVNEAGEPVLEDPLAARDVVSRAEWAQLQAGHEVFIDARQRPGAAFPRLFPSIAEKAAAAGLDPRRDLIPVSPAAHYHMGGVLVDRHGQSTVPGLYAVGEVASTGLHGANRLASNSLLEAVVCGRWAAQHLKRATLPVKQLRADELAVEQACDEPASTPLEAAQTASGRPARHAERQPGGAPAGPDAAPTWRSFAGLGAAEVDATLLLPAQHDQPGESPLSIQAIRQLVGRAAGVTRDEATLRQAQAALASQTSSDAGLVAWLLVSSALARRESRGGHARSDHPATADRPGHTIVVRSDAEAALAR